MRARASAAAAVAILAVLAACKSSTAPPPAAAPPLDPSDFIAAITSNPPCVLGCPASCAEANAPWTCPALADWDAIPHADSCNWDGVTTPAVTPGACVASAPTGDAIAPVSRTAPFVIPDGRRLAPAGSEWLFDEPDLVGTFPGSALLIPGTKWLAVADTGDGVESVRIVDTTILLAGGAASPVVSYVPLPQPHGAGYEMAWRASTSTLYVPGSELDATIDAYDVNTTTGAITQDASKAIALPMGTFPNALALSADGASLVVGQVTANAALVYDLGSPSAPPVSIDLGAPAPFAIRFDPNDPTGNTAWATFWTYENVNAPDTMRIERLDLSKKAVTATVPIDKSPEEIAFLSLRWAVVASGLGDALSIINLSTGAVAATIPLAGLPGQEPTTLAWDPTRARLYATLASRNAVLAFDVYMGSYPPTLTPAGSFPTAWWPTSVVVDPSDGTAYVTNGKGHGTKADTLETTIQTGGDIMSDVTGSVQAVPYMTDGALAAAQATVDAQNDVEGNAGYPTVTCNGAPYDFPIPTSLADGPSTKIKHVIFIVRENKTFDAIFGDVTGADGDPSLVEAPGNMDAIWPNTRALGATFSHAANFYEDAEESVQGHTWTVFGRTTDYDERDWFFTGGSRAYLSVTASSGVGASTQPEEGSIFTSIANAGYSIENAGELTGALQYRDFSWPGGSPNGDVPDTEAACWMVGHMRAACDMKDFTYAWLVNDHTMGLSAGFPNPAVMIATNDEATGMMVEGISHSPYWPDTLVIIVEDDPQDGSDHVDHHRTIAIFASPWVKRGYVTHGHYDMASVHRLLAHVYATPYRNDEVAKAPLPLDVFTSTPDYTPFTHVARKWTDLSCNPSGTPAAKLAERWDFSHVDEQPGLSSQLGRYFRSLPPR